MANRIKGITVEIGGDTTKLQTALKGVNGQIKNTQSALKDVEKLLKLDPTNTTLLAQNQKLLTQAIGETKEKLATLKTAAQQANDIDYDIKPAVNEWNGKQNGNCKYQMKRNKKIVLTGNCCTNHANGYGHYVTANSVRFAEYSYQYVFN